jgi:hypothetical protein
MKIILCGSLSASDEMLQIRNELLASGHEVEVPHGVKKYEARGGIDFTEEEKANDKVEHDLIRGYFEKIKDYDIVLVVNPEKKDVPGYIGGNTLIEMAFGHVLGKKLYCLYPLPEMSYISELAAMQPTILDGDLTNIKG